jgi:hypothetical protein
MKSISFPIQLFLQRKEFSFFIDLQNILKELFQGSFDQITCIEVKKKKLYIGVAIPQLVWHYNTLKKNILSQVIAKMPGLIYEVSFIFYVAVKKSSYFDKRLQCSSDKKNNFGEMSDKNKVYSTIRSHCYKDDYHDLLYGLYLKRIEKRHGSK